MALAGRIIVIVLGVLIALLALAWLLLRRPDIPYATLEERYGNAQSRYLDLPGGLHIHYRDQGRRDGPVLVMVHGFSASLEAWEPWVARLSNDYRIVTLDLPGHGLTRAPAGYKVSVNGYADITDQVAKALNLPPYVIIGNSMGGGVAWTLALHHPQNLRGLVLVDAAGWPTEPAGGGEPKDTPLIFKLLQSGVGRAILGQIDTRPMAQSGLKAAYVDPAIVTPALVSRYVDLSRAPGHRAMMISILTLRGEGATPDSFKAIHVPTLVMHGDKDVLIPLDNSQSFAAAIPGARLIVYPGVGHVPMEQIPDQSAADLRAFLASLPPVPAAGTAS